MNPLLDLAPRQAGVRKFGVIKAQGRQVSLEQNGMDPQRKPPPSPHLWAVLCTWVGPLAVKVGTRGVGAQVAANHAIRAPAAERG
jgi:hypothetical protein